MPWSRGRWSISRKLRVELTPAERELVARGLSVQGAKNISLDPKTGRLGGIDAGGSAGRGLDRHDEPLLASWPTG